MTEMSAEREFECESVSLSDEDENFPVSSVRTRTVQTNPLRIDQIMERVFRFCDELTLQQVRQVCLQWDADATKELLRNVYIASPYNFHVKMSLEEQEELRAALKRLISYLGHFDLLRFRIADFRDTQVFHEAKILGERVGHLAYGLKDARPSEHPVGMNTQHLARILGKLPNLQVLETSCLDLAPEQEWLTAGGTKIVAPVANRPDEAENNGDNEGPEPEPEPEPGPVPEVQTENNSELEKLLTRLESLKEIHLNFWLTPELLVDYFPHRKRLEAIRSLKVNRESVFTLYTNFGISWKIQRLRMMINNEISTEWTRHFLRSMSGSLEHLRLSFFFRHAKVIHTAVAAGAEGEQGEGQQNELAGDHPSVPDISNAHIPWSLSNLRSLDIYEDDPRLEFTVWKTIVAALQLPRLKKLTIRSSITIYFDEMARQWATHRQRPLRSDSLEKLVLYPSSFSISTILFSNCWPRLKYLLIKLDLNEIATMTALYAIYSDLCKLERLELILQDDHSSEHQWNRQRSRNNQENFDDLLVGVRRPLDYTTGPITDWAFVDSLQTTEFKSIRNLKCLKFLKIESTTCERHGWTDFTVYHGLVYLKSLQSIEITRKFVSDKAIEDLKLALGYNVNVFCYPDDIF